MASASLHGECPPPFLQESLFPIHGGYTLGRFCSRVPGVAHDQSCCLPCPATDYFYPDNFYNLTRIAGYINVVALALCLFMLLSFALLPIDATRRHYLNVCLLFSIILLQLGFIIPWAQKPDQCYNQITPNDDLSSLTCAFGGALEVCGGVAITMWILIRAFSMHLQICWGIEPGKIFFWVSHAVAWPATIILVATEMSISGVSFRFGDYCHVNAHKSLGTLWIPLLTLAGISLFLQLATFGYCLHVYVKHAIRMFKPETVSSHADSTITSFRSANARAVFRRVRQVLILQWRGLAIAIIVVADVIFFSLVYTILDQKNANSAKRLDAIIPWLECLIIKQDKNICLPLAKPLVLNGNLLIAVLLMLAVVGIEAFILLTRWQMISAWFTLCSRRLQKSREMNEFVSLDARLLSTNKATIELNAIPSPTLTQPANGKILTEPNSPHNPPKLITPLTRIENTNYYDEHFRKETLEREYHSPSTSFSRPRAFTSRSANSSLLSNGTMLSEAPSTYSVQFRTEHPRHSMLPKIEDDLDR